MKNGLAIIIFFLTGLAIEAQLVKRPVIIESKVHTGMILPFYKALSYLVEDDISAFDLSVGFPGKGKDYWEKLYNYPKQGIGYSYWNLGNKEVFGNAHVLYGFINFPIYRKSEKFSVNYSASLGLAYLTKKFDINENHLDRAIGSHLNAYVRYSIDGKIKILPNWELLIEAGGTHFSNGKTKSPNYGINAGTFSLGLNYFLNNNAYKREEPEIPPVSEYYVQSILYSAGSKVYDNLLGKKYLTTSASYNIERILSHRRRAGLGADLFYDGSIREALATQEGVPEDDFTKLIRIGVHGSYTAKYKQLMMGVQIGCYLYSKYNILSPLYNRLTVQYLFTQKISGSISLRSHMGKADSIEYGIGYYW